MGREWITDIPAEIRTAIYKWYFGSIVKVHATQGTQAKDCRQLSFNNPRIHLALLRTCKSVSKEAVVVLHEQCQLQIADCNCWREGQVPRLARQNIRHIVSPFSFAGFAYFRLAKVFDTRDMPPSYPEPHQLKRLTYSTIFSVANEEDIKKLNKLVALTWDAVAEVNCWVQVKTHLIYVYVGKSHDMILYNTKGLDTVIFENLVNTLLSQCSLVRSVAVITPDDDWLLQNMDRITPQIDFVGT